MSPLYIYAVCLVLTSVAAFSADNRRCQGPQMKLISDNPRQTCTDITASPNRIAYSCRSLIPGEHGFDHSMMRYCPVEVCTDNGTWSKPSISCALSECFTDARLYTGHRICTASGRHCQRWDRQDPHTHRFKKDAMFPENSVSRAEAFCRDPEGDKGKPWCLTTDPDKKWEYCDIQKCSDVHIWDGSCRGASIPKDDVDDRRTETDAKENKTHKDKAKQAALCMKNSANFNMKRGFRVSAIEFTHLTTRSFLECAAQCAKLLECRMLSYRVEDRYCLFYDNDNFGTVKSRAYKVGAKLCKKID